MWFPEHLGQNVESGSEVKFVANGYTNPIINPKTLTTLNLTLTDLQPDPKRTSRRLWRNLFLRFERGKLQPQRTHELLKFFYND